jgi:hypothetical protein
MKSITLPIETVNAGLFRKPEYLGLWIKLIATADDNGEITRPIRRLADDLDTTYQKLRDLLNYLASTQQITQVYNAKATQITICNYESYEGSRRKDNATNNASQKRKTTDKSSSNTLSLELPQKTTRFIPPTLDELRSYIQLKGYNVDPEKFLAYYESNGWMVGRNKMKNWRSALVTWNRSQYGKPYNSPRPPQGHYSRIRDAAAALLQCNGSVNTSNYDTSAHADFVGTESEDWRR